MALVDQGVPLNYGKLIELVALLSAEKPDVNAIARLLDGFPFDDHDRKSLIRAIEGLRTKPPMRPCGPINLNQLESSLTQAIDPPAGFLDPGARLEHHRGPGRPAAGPG